MSTYGSRWSRDETLLAFALYCELPFGKLHQHNAYVASLAQRIRRTPSSVAMKACNFASLDPAQQERGIKGLTNASQTEREIWEEFFHDSDAVVDEIDQARSHFVATTADTQAPRAPSGPSDIIASIRVRRHQTFFRSSVLSTYNRRCAITSLAVPELLVASHIIPWSEAKTRRCDPTNGLCLNALHDRAFDRGLITFDDQLRLVVAPALLDGQQLGLLHETLPLIGRQLDMPDRFQPDSEALRFHRERVFKK